MPADRPTMDHAANHLSAAVRSLATSEDRLADRLQTAWDDHVQMIWMQPCLTRDLLQEFRDLWRRYTAPSDDRESTQLRELTHDEAAIAIEEVVALASSVVIAAQAAPDARLATLADLD